MTLQLEMRCHRTILGIRYVTIDAVQNIIRQETSLLGNHVTTVKNRKLKWYSQHIRANTLSITILQSTTLGKRGGRGKSGLIISLNGQEDHSQRLRN